MIHSDQTGRFLNCPLLLRIAASVILLLSLTRCTLGGLMLVEPEVSPSDIDQARLDLQNHQINPSRTLDSNQMHNTLVNLWQSLKEPLINTCREVLPASCENNINRIQVKLVNENSVNAYADGTNWVIGVHSGLMRSAGDDDEIAAVLGHEAAHLLFSHSEKKAANSALNGLIGGILMAGLAAALDVSNPDVMADMMQTGLDAGVMAGYLMHSPEMELEADQFAMYALARADRRLTAGTDLIVRLHRGDVPLPVKQGEGWASYLTTHPADDHRLAAMRTTFDAITTGASAAPITKEWADFSRKNGYSSLHLATFRGKADTLNLLVKNGADLEARDKKGWTSLHIASQRADHDAMDTLLDAGADLEARTHDGLGYTPLHLASASARPGFITRLLEAGAEIESLSADRSTPLHVAAAEGTADVVELLLDAGANAGARNQQGQTPYMLGQENRRMLYSNALERLQDVR